MYKGVCSQHSHLDRAKAQQQKFSYCSPILSDLRATCPHQSKYGPARVDTAQLFITYASFFHLSTSLAFWFLLLLLFGIGDSDVTVYSVFLCLAAGHP